MGLCHVLEHVINDSSSLLSDHFLFLTPTNITRHQLSGTRLSELNFSSDVNMYLNSKPQTEKSSLCASFIYVNEQMQFWYVILRAFLYI